MPTEKEFEIPDLPPLPSRRFQFSMATLMIVMTAFCFWLAIVARPAFKLSGNAGVIQAGLAILPTLLMVIGWWKIFEKAGQPGWGALIPIYNLLLLLRVARRPAWWIVLLVIPLVNWIPLVLVPLDIARHFGKSHLFGAGLIFLGFIFYPILGFGAAQYQTPTYIRYHGGKPYVCE